jgi:hypothetical protein
MQKTEGERLILRYLLGRVSEEEQAWIEEQFFTDNQFYEQLRIVEAALVDDYVRDRLEPDDRESFEHQFLSSSEMRQEVTFASELISVARELKEADEKQSELPVPAPISIRQRLLAIIHATIRVPKYALVLGLLIIAVLIAWNTKLQRQVGRIELDTKALRAELERQKELADNLAKQIEPKRTDQNKDETTPPPSQSNTDKTPTRFATVILSPLINTRGKGSAKSFALSPDSRWFQIIIELAKSDKYAEYSVSIMNYDGVEILPKTNAKPDRSRPNRIILRHLPASNFPDNDYILTLEGREAGKYNYIRDYYFSITRSNTR